jgi:hypothetical protein
LAGNIKITLNEIGFGGFEQFSVIQVFLFHLTEKITISKICYYREVNTLKMASLKCKCGVPSLRSLCEQIEVAEQVSYVTV